MKKVFLLLTAVLFANVAFAHETGLSFEKAVGDYVVDVGFDADTIKEAESVQLDAVLWNKEKTQSIDYTDVFVRIQSSEEETVFASDFFKPQIGSAGAIFAFPKTGDYVMELIFIKDEQSLAKADFQVNVKEVAHLDTVNSRGDISSWWNFLAVGVAGFILGAAIVWFLKGTK